MTTTTATTTVATGMTTEMKLDRLLQVAYEMTFRKEPTITKDEAEDRQGNPTTMYTLDGTLVLYACKSPEGAEGFALDVIVPGRDEFEGADYTEIGWYPNLALVVTTAVGGWLGATLSDRT